MRLPGDIRVKVAGETIELRPTLRAAMRLDRDHGGFANLARKIADGSLTAICDVIDDHADMPFLEARVWGAGIDRLQGPLLEYVFALTGNDPDGAPSPDDDGGERISHREFHERLFRIGTGWLGWPPETVWEATPAEIIEAHKGRVDMLRSIFGGETKPKSTMPLGDKLATVMRSFGTKVVRRKPKTAEA